MSEQPAKPAGKGSAPFALAHWFVTQYLKRPWNGDDEKGRHLKHAQLLLKDDSLEFIQGCLRAMRDGRVPIGKFEVRWLIDVRNGEPPFISTYRALANHPPPKWMQTSYRDWVKEFDPHQEASPLASVQEPEPCLHYPPPISPSSARSHIHNSTRRTWR